MSYEIGPNLRDILEAFMFMVFVIILCLILG